MHTFQALTIQQETAPLKPAVERIVRNDSRAEGVPPSSVNLDAFHSVPTSAGMLSKPAAETMKQPACRACSPYLSSIRSMKSVSSNHTGVVRVRSESMTMDEIGQRLWMRRPLV